MNESKVVLITGATGAIGSQMVRAFANRGAKVLMLVRNKGKAENIKNEIIAETKNNSIHIIEADMGDMATISKAVEFIKVNHKDLNTIVHTVGAYKPDRTLLKNGLETMFATNYLGLFLLTNSLFDVLKLNKNSHVFMVSTANNVEIAFDNLQGEKYYKPFANFVQTVVAKNTFAMYLSKELKSSGVSVTLYMPGLVKNEIHKSVVGFMGFIMRVMQVFASDGKKSASELVKLAYSENAQSFNGKFMYFNKQIKFPERYYNSEVQKKLVKASLKLVNINGEKNGK